MKLVFVAIVLAANCSARADAPPGTARRLAHFVLEGCAYLRGHSLQLHKPDPPDKMLAAHFGSIVGAEPSGVAIRYALNATALIGWNVSYFRRGVDIQLPPTVALTVGDLRRYFGTDETPDVDNNVSGGAPATAETESRQFKPKGAEDCYVTIRAEVANSRGPARRVLSLHFSD